MFSAEDYRALRNAAAVVLRGDRGVLAVDGADRLTWLQGLLTNDVAALPEGGICYSAYLTPQGRMITDMRVVNALGRVLLDVPGALAEPLRQKLDGLLFAEDAAVADHSASIALIEIHGPAAAPIVDRLRPALAAQGVVTARDDPYGVPGLVFFAPVEEVDAVVQSIVEEGARVVSLETLEVLRIEAGSPAFLIDMDEHTIPLEAGIAPRAISFTKGCYVGQEVIVRVTQRGQGRVARRLVGLLLEPGPAPHGRDRITAGGRDVGWVTSATWSPTLERPIALGYVHRDLAVAGTEVEIASSAGKPDGAVERRRGTVTALPFVRPA